MLLQVFFCELNEIAEYSNPSFVHSLSQMFDRTLALKNVRKFTGNTGDGFFFSKVVSIVQKVFSIFSQQLFTEHFRKTQLISSHCFQFIPPENRDISYDISNKLRYL